MQKNEFRSIRFFLGALILSAALLCLSAAVPASADASPAPEEAEPAQEAPKTPVSLISTPAPLISLPETPEPAPEERTAEDPISRAFENIMRLITEPTPPAETPAPSAAPAPTFTPEPTYTPAPTAAPSPTPVPSPTPEPFRPACTLHTLNGFTGRAVEAEELREYVDSEEPFTLSYFLEPDWDQTGCQAGVLRIRNEAGQSYMQPFVAVIKKDTKPPVLRGVHKIIAYVGESVRYLDGVWAEDNADPDPVITVNAAKVNNHKAGTYKITYTATDYSGNKRSKKAEVAFMVPKYTAEYVYELADKVLDKITKPGMTQTEKLRAIFNWGREHITYGYGVGNKDWRRAAVQGFTKGTGDCFVFYSCSRALLDEVGIKYLSIQRKGGRTHHYWMLVNMGTGWYHFDTTIANRHKHKCFMWTDAQCQVKAYFWRYDHSLYPKVATEPFNYKAQVAYEKEKMAAAKNE